MEQGIIVLGQVRTKPLNWRFVAFKVPQCITVRLTDLLDAHANSKANSDCASPHFIVSSQSSASLSQAIFLLDKRSGHAPIFFISS